MTCNVKPTVSLSISPTILSSPTSGQGSTSNERGCSPFFDEQKKDVYDRLWLPQKIECVDSPLSSSSSSWKNAVPSSKFCSKKTTLRKGSSPTTSCLSFKSSAAAETEGGGNKLLRARKIRLKPTPHQRNVLEMFASHHRYTYNKTMAFVKKDLKRLNKLRLRNKFVTLMIKPRLKVEEPKKKGEKKIVTYGEPKMNSWFKRRGWLLKTPKMIRQSAVEEVAKNMKSGLTNLKNGNIKHFDMRFLSRKKGTWTIGVEKSAIRINSKRNSHITMFPKTLGDVRYHEPNLPVFKGFRDGRPVHDCKIHKTVTGKYYLIVPYAKQSNEIKQDDTRPKVAIDPGVRTFMTTYDTDGVALHLAENAMTTLFPMLRRIDRCVSAQAKAKTKRQHTEARRMKLVLLERFQHIKDDMHHKLARFLVDRYSTIVIPHFGVKSMTSRRMGRKLTTKTSRSMLSLAHGEFRVRLEEKAKETGTIMIVGDEAYTTKTCGRCGTQNEIGGSKTFRCQQCHLVADRDVHAARNIFLKHLVVHSDSGEGDIPRCGQIRP